MSDLEKAIEMLRDGERDMSGYERISWKKRVAEFLSSHPRGVAQPKQEPVAWRWRTQGKWILSPSDPGPFADERQPLYTLPSTLRGSGKPICQNCGDPVADALHAVGFCGTCREMGASLSSNHREGK